MKRGRVGLGGNSLEEVDKGKSPTELPLSVGNFPINSAGHGVSATGEKQKG